MLQRDEHGSLSPGSVLKDKYRIVRVLGRGGFAQTYLAEDLGLDSRPVAVKEYLPSGISRIGSDGTVQAGQGSDGSREFARGRGSFLNEAKALAGIKHPNVVDVLERFEAHGTAYLVLAFEPGPTLEQRLNGESPEGGRTPPLRIDADGVIDLAKALLSALVAVHAAGRVHGDLKPANIILRPPAPGRPALDPVLIDFGAARGDSLSRTATIMAVASAGYSPPEQYEADSDDHAAEGSAHSTLVPASDLYALGATLYRAVSGKVPVVSTKRQSALFRQKPDPLPKARDAAPPERFGAGDHPLLDWIDSLMEVDVDQRVASAAKALKQLGRLDRAPASPQAAEATRLVREAERFPQSAATRSTRPSGPADDAPRARSGGSPRRWLLAAGGVLGLGVVVLLTINSRPPVPGTSSIGAPANLRPGAVFSDRLSDGSAGPEMVVIPAGTVKTGFQREKFIAFAEVIGGKKMTAEEESESESLIESMAKLNPTGESQLPAFAVARNEISRSEFLAFVRLSGYRTEAERDADVPTGQNSDGSNPGCFALDGKWREDLDFLNPDLDSYRDSHPVVCVSWNDAQAYVEWLSASTGRHYRLPSMIEHQYLASTTYPNLLPKANRCAFENLKREEEYDGKNAAEKKPKTSFEAQFDCEDGFVHSAPAGSLQTNGLGVRHMLGNVSEWTEGCATDARHRSDCRNGRVYFLGSFLEEIKRILVFSTGFSFGPTGDATPWPAAHPSYRSTSLGFRVVRETGDR